MDSEYAAPGARDFMSARVRSLSLLATFLEGPIDRVSIKRSGDNDLSETQGRGMGRAVGVELWELVD